jgi:16S rRNA (adenine1518-N6/adenine1519-N6)-dimethyltransferase
MSDVIPGPVRLFGASDVRALAAELGLRPTKKLGQNFVHDANTVRRIVRLADVPPGATVLEVGPGLGSLTLALLDAVGPDGAVVAVEVDPVLAGRLPATAAERAPGRTLHTVTADALRLRAADVVAPDRPGGPTALVANLPYNVAVPVVLHLLAELGDLRTGLVMVQSEVADRLAARPGEDAYGGPSSQRRKSLRAALAGWAGSPALAEERLRAAGVDPAARGEQLGVAAFAAIATTAPDGARAGS